MKARLLACEEQGGDTDSAFMWINTALEVQRDGAEVSGSTQLLASSQTSSTSANSSGNIGRSGYSDRLAIAQPAIARTSLFGAWRKTDRCSAITA